MNISGYKLQTDFFLNNWHVRTKPKFLTSEKKSGTLLCSTNYHFYKFVMCDKIVHLFINKMFENVHFSHFSFD